MFSTTSWTIIHQAAQNYSSSGKIAWAEIARKYWSPLYFFARQQGLATQDAEDATQEFLIKLIEGKLLSSAEPARGRFRTFLLTAWKRFLIDRHRGEHRIRRGGNVKHESMFSEQGEERMLSLVPKNAIPDDAFSRGWATAIIDQAKNRLRDDYVASGKYQLYDCLSPYLTQPISASLYEEMETRLQRSTGAIKVAVHRLRQRFGETLREIVSETVEDPNDTEKELRELLGVLTQPGFDAR